MYPRRLLSKQCILLFAMAAALAAGPCLVQPPRLAAQQNDQPGGRGRFAGMQRLGGEVTAVAGKTLTVKGEDGAVYQVVTTDNTRLLRRAGGGADSGAAEGEEHGRGGMMPSTLTDIKVGDGVMAMGMMDAPAHMLHAAVVLSTDASVLAAMRANLGKMYISGRVVSVDLDNASMAVMRPDGVTQTIGFDESTSFRRGRPRGSRQFGEGGEPGAAPDANPGAAAGPGGADDSITLADVRPGDTVFGRGSLKHGTFVPSELTVAAPHRPHGGPAMPAPGAVNR